jgi:hypothetical protein
MEASAASPIHEDNNICALNKFLVGSIATWYCTTNSTMSSSLCQITTQARNNP